MSQPNPSFTLNLTPDPNLHPNLTPQLIGAIDVLQLIGGVIGLLFFVCYVYQLVYIPVALCWGRRKRAKTASEPPSETHPGARRYAVLIAARNEQAVIGHLLDSIRGQDYPGVSVFVVADNCTDQTAEVARLGGAVVYERHNAQLVGKGYALDYLLRHIRADYGDVFDGYFVFDADNLLAPNYITEMDRVFARGVRVVTSYRNSKNYGDNWISAGYALWFLREAAFLNHPRSILGTSCAVSGTGFLVHRALLADGWPYYLLTEDIEFSVCQVLAGETIGYCPTAVFYDEQPVTFRQSWRQRMRWAKGYLQVFRRHGGQLLRRAPRQFACFDLAMAILPAIALTVVGLAVNLAAAILQFRAGLGWAALAGLGRQLAGMYLFLLALGGLTTLTQWRQIHTSTGKKLAYTLTFPLFMLTYLPISFAALFRRVDWQPIEHRAAISLQSLEGDRQPAAQRLRVLPPVGATQTVAKTRRQKTAG